MLGKLATHEFAIGGPAFDLPWPPARNPWDTRRFTGGSSSGSGAAVAAGLALGALGSDTGGSIRLPAAYCGIAGIKPTPGLVSRRGVIRPGAPSPDTVGPMAWTAQDCAILLDALRGATIRPTRRRCRDRRYPMPPRIAAPLRGVRVGLLRRFYEHDVPASPEMLQMMSRAAATLRSLGCRVEDATLPSVQEYNAVGRVIISSESYALHEATLKQRLSDYSRVFRVRVLAGALIRAADYIAAQRRRTDLIAATAKTFERFDVLVTAPTAGSSPMLTEQRPWMRVLPAIAHHGGERGGGAVDGGVWRLHPGRAAAGGGDHGPRVGRRDGAARGPPFRAGHGHAAAAAGAVGIQPRIRAAICLSA